MSSDTKVFDIHVKHIPWVQGRLYLSLSITILQLRSANAIGRHFGSGFCTSLTSDFKVKTMNAETDRYVTALSLVVSGVKMG